MKALIMGSTGLVGTEVLKQCIGSPSFTHIVTISRRSTGVKSGKLQEIIHKDFKDFSTIKDKLSDIDVCFYCLGISQNAVSKNQYWEITCSYLEALIQAFENCGGGARLKFCYCSGEGAASNEKSFFRFANVKGHAENMLNRAKFSESYIFRPSFIYPSTPRVENNLLENMIYKPLYSLFPSMGIKSTDLATAMLSVGIRGHEKNLLKNEDLLTLSQQLKLASSSNKPVSQKRNSNN